MKFMSLYDDCLHPVAQHLAELCRHFNQTGDLSYFDMILGAVNMAHTFGLGCTVFQHPQSLQLLYVCINDYNTDEVIILQADKDPETLPLNWYNCRAILSRSKHGMYSE